MHTHRLLAIFSGVATLLSPKPNDILPPWTEGPAVTFARLVSNRITILLLIAIIPLFALPWINAQPLPPPVTVFASGQDGYTAYRIPSVIRAANGDLLAFCEARKNGLSDAGDIDLVMKRSTDGGLSWGSTQVVWTDGENTCGNPCPVLDESTGTLHLLLTHNLGADKERDIIAKTSIGTRTVWVTRSTDNGKTWTKPIDITKNTKDSAWGWYATGPGVGIQIKHGPRKGRLVIPCNHSYDLPDGKTGTGSHVIFSDDHGNTWQLGGNILPIANESQVVELSAPAGAIQSNARRDNSVPSSESNLRGVSTSTDGGLSWSPLRPHPGLPEPICQASILRHSWPSDNKPGLVLFSNPSSPVHAKKRMRENMTVRFSWDDGETWPKTLQLNEDFAAYSCLVSLSETEAACLYEHGGNLKIKTDRYREIIFQRFSVE